MRTPMLSIFAKWPAPGAVKTRLIPALGADGAAAVYRKLLDHTVREAQASGLPMLIRGTGAPLEQLAWLAENVVVAEQGEGDLGARLAEVPAPALVIGSDAPGLTAALLREAARALETHAAVIGPATDGGYYLIGFSEPVPFAFAGIEWSTGTVFAETMRRFEARGIFPHVLPELDDIDTADDLARWPDFAP